nr:immunoglobulin heavy chain junction region [Macaca mulatta]MOX01670.1 immunoglobulin heavy chain junction region [Macaca mulatta]MOX02100.1 immunoglobulin heavy chain junction region [Macaca mulatta]MOX02150.1 immunoglobulin heavy chain junction region [Macaca mulatta]
CARQKGVIIKYFDFW